MNVSARTIRIKEIRIQLKESTQKRNVQLNLFLVSLAMKSFTTLLSIFSLVSAKSLTAGDHGVRVGASGNFSSKASSQTLVCYDYNGGGGDSVRAIDYIPALRSYNFDNRISSCCFTGTWILYAEQNYNGYSVGSSNWWAYGENACMDTPAQFSNVASSLR